MLQNYCINSLCHTYTCTMVIARIYFKALTYLCFIISLSFCTYQISAEKSSESDRIASKIKVLFQWLLEIKIEGDKKMLCIAHINRTKYLILENKDKIMYAKKENQLYIT